MQVELSGYKLTEELHHSPRTLIFRGINESDQQPVIIKTLNKEYPLPQELARYQHEYRLIKDLSSPGVIKTYGLEKYGNNLAIVLEDFNAVNLASLAQASDAIELETFFKIAISIAKTFGDLHNNHQVIHKDIHPRNILWNPSTETVKLIDFSGAVELSKEHQDLYSSNHLLSESLPYISPEQTGRMNRDVDYRSDYYSLGVTLYELITGKLPFQAKDPMDWMHCHIAKLPPVPSEMNSDIPKMVDAIILKLMAKNAEDRYQSSHGLVVDLTTCQQQWSEEKKIQEFELGQEDISPQFQLPQKLYGRESELETLLSTFGEVTQGQSHLLLVTGYSGVGKSSLINEIHKPIVKQKGYFIEGKFDQFQRDIPYSAIAQAFQGLVQQLLSEPKESLALWKEKVLQATAPNAQILIDIIPDLEKVLGEQPPVQELNPTEAQNRFLITFRNFVNVFAQAEHPLVLFLDDLQWSDIPTINLLKGLLESKELKYVFVVGAYRDNEVQEGHPLMLFLDEVQKQRTIQTLSLKPLNQEITQQIVADTLHCDLEQASPLAGLVYEKTQGNPFFMGELLTNLYQENYLSFVHQEGVWRWDLDKIQEVGVSSNVIEFMIQRLQKLPLATQKALQLAACIGNQFDLKTLSIISEQYPSITAKAVWTAVRAGILIPLSNQFVVVHEQDSEEAQTSSDFGVSYKFQHDRVQQAAYSLIKDDEKHAVHLSIGRLMLQSTPEEELEEKIIEIVRQLNEGRELIKVEGEQIELAKLNLTSGIKAKKSAAYKSALQYLSVAKQLMPQNSWDTFYDLTFKIFQEYSLCTYLCGEFSEAEKNSEFLLEHAKTRLEKAEVLRMKLVQYGTLGRLEKSIQAGIEGLEFLGIKVSPHPKQAQVIADLLLAKWNLGGRKISDLKKLPTLSDTEKQLSMRILTELFAPAYLTANQNLFALLVLKAVNISLKNGNTPESALAYTSYGLLLVGVLGNLEPAYEFGKLGIQLNESFQDLESRCRNLAVYSFFIHHWNEHWRTIPEHFKRALEAGYQSGDLMYSGYACDYIVPFDPEINLELAIQEGEKYISIIEGTKYQDALDLAQVLQHFRLNLCGLASSSTSLSSFAFEETTALERMKRSKFLMGVGGYYNAKLQVHFFHEDYELGLTPIQAIDKQIESLLASPFKSEFTLYAFLTYAALLPEMSGWWERRKAWWRLRKEHRQMKKWADHCPVNFLHHQLLMEAEMMRLKGKPRKAAKLYEQAIKAAQEHEYLRYEALCNELAAKFYLGLGQEKIASVYMKDAHYCYTRWGAKAKVQDLEEKYGNLLGRFLANENATTRDSNNTNTAVNSTSNDLDFNTAIQTSQAISQEIEISKLLEEVMRSMIKASGADKGFLFLKQQDQMILEVESRLEDQEILVKLNRCDDFGDNPPFANSLITYVQNKEESKVVHDATQEAPFDQDPYVIENQTKSILCAPIIGQGELEGLFYLENGLTTNSFTQERLHMLQMLAAQAAISIKNARSYEHQKQLTDAYSRFVPDEFLFNLNKKSVIDIELGDHMERDVTVMFSDIRSFTSMSEKMSPKDNFQFLNSYLQVMEPIIRANGGYIDKYIGDAIMALFLPQTEGLSKDQALKESSVNCMRTAIMMLRELSDYNTERRQKGKVPIDIGLGANIGSVVLGTIGGHKRIQGTVISDAVNVASRIESLTKAYGVGFLISESLYFSLREKMYDFQVRIIDRLQVRGRDKEVTLYEVFDGDPPEKLEQKLACGRQFEEAIQLYGLRDFKDARKLFQECMKICPTDLVSEIYEKRCLFFSDYGPEALMEGIGKENIFESGGGRFFQIRDEKKSRRNKDRRQKEAKMKKDKRAKNRRQQPRRKKDKQMVVL